MDSTNKMRVVTDYVKLTDQIQEQIKLAYPTGFSDHLITFMDKSGNTIKGLRFETDEKIYLVRMTVVQAKKFIEDDEDYDEDGNLFDDVKDEYEEKYTDDLEGLEDIPDESSNPDDDED